VNEGERRKKKEEERKRGLYYVGFNSNSKQVTLRDGVLNSYLKKFVIPSSFFLLPPSFFIRKT
jgi:hypothetical protein